MPVDDTKVLSTIGFAIKMNPIYTPKSIKWMECANEVGEFFVLNTIVFTGANQKVLQQNNWEAYAISISTDDLAQFGYESTEPNTLVSASVYLDYPNTNTTILHEYMHAWGWGHAAKVDNHLMSPTSGYDIQGLSNYVLETSEQSEG